MKKIFIIIVLFFNSILSFADFKDTLNLLKEEDKKNIEEKIKIIEKNKKIKFYVNILPIEEGFAVSDPERTIIFNLKKMDKTKKFLTELSFSKDIEVEDIQTEIDDIFKNTKDLLKNEEYNKYILTILDETDSILQDVSIEPLNQMTMTKEQNQSGNNLYVVLIIIFLVIIIILIILKRLNLFENQKKEK